MKLSELSVGQSAVLTEIGGEGALRQHFLDMGLIPGSLVTLEKFAPLGDPMQLDVHGYELTLRLADADKILHWIDLLGGKQQGICLDTGHLQTTNNKWRRRILYLRGCHTPCCIDRMRSGK